MAMASRRQQLERMLAESPADSFLVYGVALEYIREGSVEEGLMRLRGLVAENPDYQAAYFQLGQVLTQEGEVDEARHWLELGVAAAQRIGDAKAAREMSEFLSML
jgi:thioredoxin-like negative regulator of GroEL